MEAGTNLSAADAALVSTIYDPPRARRPWRVSDVLPAGATTYYSLARWALRDALRACGVGPGDRVLLPALICREVLAPIKAVGAIAEFYSVSPQLRVESGDADLIRAKAVLAVNYFGFPQELDVFRRYCERTGAALIEDNAHGFLSRDTHGHWLGSRGDAGLFSFRKTIAVPDGGALVLTGDRRMAETPHAPSRNAPGVHYRAKQAFRRVARRLGPVPTVSAIAAVRQLRKSLTGAALPVSAADAETRMPIASNPPAFIGRRIDVADPDLESRRRRALYDLSGRILAAAGVTSVFAQLPPNVVPYGFPVYASPAQVPGISAHLARHGLPLSRWPDLPAAIGPSAAEHYRQLVVVPFLW